MVPHSNMKTGKRRLSVMLLGFWILVSAALASAEDDMEAQTAAPEESIRQSQDVCAGEQEYIQQRTQIVLEALTRLGINCSEDSVPRIALLGSGGGERAAMGLVGSLLQMEKDGLLDTVLYLGGVSGSTWSMASLYHDPEWSLDMTKAISKLMGPGVEMELVFDWLLNRSKEETFSLTDVWGMMTSAVFMKQLELRRLSEEAIRNATNPYPIYTAIEKGCDSQETTEDKWFEFSPHEAGFTELGLFIKTSLLGSKFDAGNLLEVVPEMDMIKLQGFCGSALADMETNKDYIPSWLQWTGIGASKYYRIHMALKKIIALLKGVSREQSDIADMDSMNQVLEDTDKKNQNESAGWENLSPEENLSYFDRMSLQLLGSMAGWSDGLPDGVSKKRYSAITKQVMPLVMNWEWGTLHNFLNQYPKSSLPSCLDSKEDLHLEDAGLMMNVPYPPFLGEKRDIDLIIALDYSNGDIFETVMKARNYSAELNKPFPEIDESILEERDWPKDCYVFEGKDKEPTIIHMPLFNRQNCKDADEVQAKLKEFSTFQRPYEEDMIKSMIATTKENMERIKETLLGEFRKAALRRAER